MSAARDSMLTFVLVLAGCKGSEGSADGPSSGDESGSDSGTDDATICDGAPELGTSTDACTVESMGAAGTLLRGTVLGPDGVLRGGEVLIGTNGAIACVDCDCDATGATVIDCGSAVISPALINPHDHITYANNAPIGGGVDRYEHRHDWRRGENGHEELHVDGGASPNEVLGAELRFIMAGATAAASAGGETGLLRNLDTSGQLLGLTIPFANSDTFPLDDSDGQQVEQGCNYGSNPTTAAQASKYPYLPHVGEGINAAAANELLCTGPRGPNDLLGPNTALIHGVALRPTDVADMKSAGAMLVWSPRSNIVLYGNTAPVTMVDAFDVPIALGTDWVASGSMDMLRELKCADELDSKHFGDHFTDREQWLMATENAARATGAAGVLGALAPGYVADITVFRATATAQDHRAVIDAASADVLLVLRGGVPLYGDDALLAQGFVGAAECEAIDVCGTPKRACVARDTQGSTSLAAVKSAIESSYPLFFCDAPTDEPTCLPFRAGEYNGVVPGDADGDGIVDGEDSCPESFDPVRPLEQAQGDADGDGVGDACDPCPLAPDDAC